MAVGSNVGRLAGIQELMSVAHGAPVLWVSVKTLDQTGPWAEANMQRWNAALSQACQQYPNLRVFDWAAVAQDGWFISDGIHYTSAGYAARARIRPCPGPCISGHRAQHWLPDQVIAGHNARMAGPGLSQPMPGYASAGERSRPNL